MNRVLTAAVVVVLLGATGYVTARQAPPSTAARTREGKWTPPRTPWGDPDIQGIWSYATTTPLERPVELGDKAFYTAEEAAARDAARVAAADGPLAPGQTGDYQFFWYDRGATAANRRTSQIIDPPNGRLPPFTPEGEKLVAARIARQKEHPADTARDLTPQVRCIRYHGIPPQPTGYNNTYEIFQIRGFVAILDEAIHDVRMIALDGRPHLGSDIRQWNGHSVGRWEGNTLVVETTNYRPESLVAFHTTEHLRSVERFTRTRPNILELQFTIDDPALYTRQWTAMIPMRAIDEKLYEYACHEGNQSMIGMLAGERALEKARADAAAKSQK